MYRFRQFLNVFAGVAQSAERTAIRQRDRNMESARPRHYQGGSGFLGDSCPRKNTWAAFVDTAQLKIRFGCAARKFSSGERRRSMSALHIIVGGWLLLNAFVFAALMLRLDRSVLGDLGDEVRDR